MLVEMSDHLLTFAVIAANVLGAAMALPQAAKLLRSRHVGGVSAGWAGMSASVNAWWGVYGIAVGDPAIVPVSVASVMAYSVIAVALVRFRAGSRRAALAPITAGFAALGVVPLAAYAIGGWTSAGIALGALYGVQLTPAVVAVHRTPDVSGVSAATWVIALAEALLWGGYGLARVDAGLLALATTGTVMSAIVLVRLFVRRPRRRLGRHPGREPVVAYRRIDLVAG